jgi:hypothetical protein
MSAPPFANRLVGKKALSPKVRSKYQLPHTGIDHAPEVQAASSFTSPSAATGEDIVKGDGSRFDQRALVFERNFFVAITAFAQQSLYLSRFFDHSPVCS